MDGSPLKRALAGLLAAGGLLTGTALYAGAAAEPVLEPVSNETSVSPLELLRSRSPVERWHQLRERWKQESAAAAPEAQAAASEPILEESVWEEPIPDLPVVDLPVAEPPVAEEIIPEMPIVEIPLFEAPDPAPAAEPPIHTISAQNERDPLLPLPEFQPDEPIPPRARPELRQGPFAPDAPVEGRELTPRDLKRITDILPFHDYEPDPEIRANDPCANLCPRPEGCPPPDGDPLLCPEELPLTDEAYAGRLLPESLFAYTATNMFYNPLYFEDPQLERYGHTYHHLIQPFDSVGLFGLQLLGLPYQMTIDPMCKHMYPLGYYRPGECAPKLHYQVPWNTRAAINQAAVTTGAFFIFP